MSKFNTLYESVVNDQDPYDMTVPENVNIHRLNSIEEAIKVWQRFKDFVRGNITDKNKIEEMLVKADSEIKLLNDEKMAILADVSKDFNKVVMKEGNAMPNKYIKLKLPTTCSDCQFQKYDPSEGPGGAWYCTLKQDWTTSRPKMDNWIKDGSCPLQKIKG